MSNRVKLFAKNIEPVGKHPPVLIGLKFDMETYFFNSRRCLGLSPMSVIGQLPVEDHLSHMETRLKIDQGPVWGHFNILVGDRSAISQ